MERKAISSNKSISSHKPENKEFFVPVKNHPRLFLKIEPNDKRSWWHRYTHPVTKKRKKVSFGLYPSTSFARACQLWRENEDLLIQNIDPKTHRDNLADEAKLAHKQTFGVISKQWEEWQAKTVSKSTISGNKRYLTYAREKLEDIPIAEISPSMILEVCKEWEEKGNYETAKRIKIKCSQVFRYASSKDLCQHDPTSLLKGSLTTVKVKHRAGIIDPKQFGQLLRDIDNFNSSIEVIHAIKLLVLLYPRNGDLRKAKWADIDFDNAQWQLKPEKSLGLNTNDMMKEIILPLPTQAIDILKAQHEFTGHTKYVFFSSRAPKENVMSENTAGKALNKAGYQDIQTPHGFRASAKTMQMERLKESHLHTELQLAHKMTDSHGEAYGRFAFIEKRTEMAQQWADYLEELKGESLV